MKLYDIKLLTQALLSGKTKVVLFGAGRWGKVALYSLLQRNVTVSYFCDSDVLKQGTQFCGVEVISPEKLAELGAETHVFVSCNYILPVLSALKAIHFTNVYNCISLFEHTDFTNAETGVPLREIPVMMERHKAACMVIEANKDPHLIIRGMDLMVTEACTMKCKDCSNLMPYYLKPKNEDPEVLLKAFEVLSKCVDRFLEVRLLGGEPFMNKRIHEIVNKLVTYPHVEKIAIFTNATIIPKDENLSCLKHPKVFLDITHYGVLSKNHDPLVRVLDETGINYTTHSPHTWTDSAKIEYREKSEKQLKDMFERCCVNDVLTLLHGKLYRCPFSANAMNLNAIPQVSDDFIDLAVEDLDLDRTRAQVRYLYTGRSYISACSFCNGRDYTVATVEPGVQTKTHLPYQAFTPTASES